MTLTLPSALRRAEIRSFGLVTSGVTLIILSLILCVSRPFVYAAVVIVSLSILGLIYPRLLRIPYRIWNKSAKLYARFAQISLMAIVYYLVVRTMGLTALSDQFTSGPSLSSSSGWVPRQPISIPAYESQYEASDPLSLQAPWTVGFVSWAWRTGNLWTVCLLPFLVFVSILEPEKDAEQVSGIYTLF